MDAPEQLRWTQWRVHLWRLLTRVRGMRWRAAYGVALVMKVLIASSATWLTWRLETQVQRAYERELIARAQAAAQSPLLVQHWLAGPRTAESRLDVLVCVVGCANQRHR